MKLLPDPSTVPPKTGGFTESTYARDHWRQRAVARALRKLVYQKEMGTEEMRAHLLSIISEIENYEGAGDVKQARKAADRLLSVAIRLSAASHHKEVSSALGEA